MDPLKLFSSYFIASRPWTFTASLIPTLLTCILLLRIQISGENIELNLADFNTAVATALSIFECVFVIVGIQAASNYINTYYDFISGRDTRKNAGDRSLVDSLVDQNTIYRLAVLLYTTCFAVVSKTVVYSMSGSCDNITSMFTFFQNNFNLYLQKNYPLAVIFILGSLLSFFYTATDYNLKSMALGDVTVFVCFGPLLMAFTGYYFPQCLKTWSLYFSTYNLTTQMEKLDILPCLSMFVVYSVLVGLLTECILHANNSRDIKMDKEAKIKTIAIMLGFRKSWYLFALMLVFCYGFSFFLAFTYHGGNMLTFLTIPISYQLLKRFTPPTMKGIDEHVAQFHLLYGFLTIVGVCCYPYPLKNLFSGR